MARARRTGSTESSSVASVVAPPEEPLLSSLECSECGRHFSRAAALGAHRRRAHGVVGTSRTAILSRDRLAAEGERPKRRGTDKQRLASVDRDALLALVFPNGIPAREEVLRETNRWLDQAERLVAISR